MRKKGFLNRFSCLDSFSRKLIDIKRMSKATSAIGKVVEKMPVISKTQIDENLILAGDRINEYGIGKIIDRMNVLIDRQSVKPRQHRKSFS